MNGEELWGRKYGIEGLARIQRLCLYGHNFILAIQEIGKSTGYVAFNCDSDYPFAYPLFINDLSILKKPRDIIVEAHRKGCQRLRLEYKYADIEVDDFFNQIKKV